MSETANIIVAAFMLLLWTVQWVAVALYLVLKAI